MPNKRASVISRWTHKAVTAHLEWIFRTTRAFPLQVVGCSLLILLLAFLSIRTVHFESDIFKLFPTSQGPLKLFLDSLKWTGGAGEAYFLLEGERDRVVAEAEKFAARLKEIKVDGAPGFRKVSYRVYDPAEAASFAQFISFAASRPYLFLGPEDAAKLAERLTPQAMDRSLQRAGSELASQAGMGSREIIAADPLYLRDLILPRLKSAARAFDLDPESPYFLSRDGQVLIIVAETAHSVQNMDFARKLVRGIEEARRGFSSQISCAGAHLSAVIDERVMKKNIIACVISSLLVVLGLFYFTYRRFLPTLLIPLIILYGTVLSFGFAGLFLSSINIISLAFTALIIGLGTDYSIHLYDRYHHERSVGREIEEALRSAVVDTGHGLFTAATTTALPFLVLGLTDVRALSELGLLVGLGVLFSLYATFFFLPPLLIFAERRFPVRRFKPLPGFALGFTWRFIGRHPGKIVLVSGLVITALLVSAFFVSFEGELKNLQPRHSEAFLTQEKIERHLSLGQKQLLLAVEGDSLEEVMARGQRIAPLVKEYLGSKGVGAWSSLAQVVNDRKVAEEVRRKITETAGSANPSADLRAALERNGFSPEQFQIPLEGLAALEKGKTASPAEAVRRLRESPLRSVVERHLAEEEGKFHLLSYIFYSGAVFDQAAFLSRLKEIDPHARATSVDLVSRQLAESVKKSFLWGFVIGGVLVLFLLLSHFRNLAGIFYALFPVTAGVTAMLGLMALTGMRLNFMNSMVLVTIMGMGSDYGLHIMHRLRGTADGESPVEYIQSGRAVLLSALTTIAGFGSLAFTDYAAMASIGWATNYGILATLVFSLVTLPAVVCLAGKGNRSCTFK